MLPAWIREGLEKMEREKQKKEDKERRDKEKEEAETLREKAEQEAEEEIRKEREAKGLPMLPRKSRFVSVSYRALLDELFALGVVAEWSKVLVAVPWLLMV